MKFTLVSARLPTLGKGMAILTGGLPGGLRIAGRTVLASGTLIVGRGETIEIGVGDLNLRVVFIDAGGPAEVRSTVILNNVVEVQFRNFSNPLGEAWTGRIEQHTGPSIRLAFMIHTVGQADSVRQVSYTISR